MLRLALSVVLFCLIGGAPVLAGAWLRDADVGFVSVGATLRRTVDSADVTTRLYADYGLLPRLTLGLDVNETQGAAGHALVFLRFPVGDPTTKIRLAGEIGFGGHHWTGNWSGMYKATLSAGRSFDSAWGTGWMAIDAAYERRIGTPDPIYKLDGAIGLSSGPKIRPMLKIETAYIPGNPVGWTVTPAALVPFKNGTWMIGVERRSRGPYRYGLNLELWRDF